MLKLVRQTLVGLEVVSQSKEEHVLPKGATLWPVMFAQLLKHPYSWRRAKQVQQV